MILDVPRFKCLVKKEFVTDGRQTGFVEAYCFAVTLIEARPLLFTVHTIGGAVYSRIPLSALYHKTPEGPEIERVDQWGSISSIGQVIDHEYLREYWVKVEDHDGLYKFTIDYHQGGFSQDPEQHKTSNIIFLENGQIVAMPNNQCRFIDHHFTGQDDTQYKRNKNYYLLP